MTAACNDMEGTYGYQRVWEQQQVRRCRQLWQCRLGNLCAHLLYYIIFVILVANQIMQAPGHLAYLLNKQALPGPYHPLQID